MGINKAILKTSTRQVFYKWLELTDSFHNLTRVEMELLAALLYHRYLLSKEIANEIYIAKVLFGTDSKKTIREELGWKSQIFLNALSSLRKKNAIIGDTIKKQFIPNIPKDIREGYKLEFDFKFKENEG